MEKDISFSRLTLHDSEDSTQFYIIKITKEQVDKLIEEIDKTLKASY